MNFAQRFVLVLLAAFFVSSIATSLAAWLCAGVVVRASHRSRAATRAWTLALYRLLPGLAALGVTAFILAPGYFRHEQRDEIEDVGIVLMLAAAGGLLILLASITRAIRTTIATAVLRRRWLATGTPLPMTVARMPAFAIDTAFPLVAVLGVFRPRLFISTSVLRGCSAGELEAIVEHERRHVSAFDNVTRLLMDAAPDALGFTRAARAVAAAWHQAVEHRADDAAARRLELASALVRVARIAGAARPVVLPASALYRGEGIEDRVRRLVSGQPDARDGRHSRALAAVTVALTAAVAAAAASTWVSGLAHTLLETIVSLP